MALKEDKILVSVEINVQSNTVNMAWANMVLRDDEVISSIPHRGAWPLDSDGEPIGVDTTAIGAKLSQLLGAAGANAQSRLAGLVSDLDVANTALSSSHETIVSLNVQIDELKDKIQALEKELAYEPN